MTAIPVDGPLARERDDARPRVSHGLADWLTTTDHKQIGLLYIGTSLVFFLLGGLAALALRLELAQPGMEFVTPEVYDQLFTMHGTIMMFLFGTPIALGLANYLLPLQIGAADMAFPRLNALSYWLFLFGGLVVVGGTFIVGGPADTGWTIYVPLSGPDYSPGPAMDMWIVGIALTGISSILGAVNFIATLFTRRAPGMTMLRVPIFTWGVLVTAGLILFSFSHVLWLAIPCLTVAGFGFMVQMASSNTVIQTIVDDEKRGRVMSFYMMAFLGTAPFGSLIAGSLSQRIGAANTLRLGGSCCIAGALWFASALPAIRRAVRPIYVRLGILPEVATGIANAAELTVPPE